VEQGGEVHQPLEFRILFVLRCEAQRRWELLSLMR
jgi:hypothetical protein